MDTSRDQKGTIRPLQGEEPEGVREALALHGAMVYATARRLAPADAEDVTQAVFLLLWKKADRRQGMRTLAGWLYRATVYACRNANKIRGRREHYEREAAMLRKETSAAPTPASAESEIGRWLDEGLLRLGEKYRQVVLLRYLEGLGTEEVASRLGLTPKAAAKRAERGVAKLRQFLASKGQDVSAASLVVVMAQEAGDGVPAAIAAQLQHWMAGGAACGKVATLTAITRKAMIMAKIKVAAAWMGVAAVVGMGMVGGVKLLGGPEVAQQVQTPMAVPLRARVTEQPTMARVAEQPTVAELRDRYNQTLNHLKSYILVFEDFSTEDGTWKGEETHGSRTIEYEMRTDGRRAKLIKKSWGWMDPLITNLPKERAAYGSRLWDGKNEYQYSTSMLPGRPPRLFLTQQMDEKQNAAGLAEFALTLYFGHALDENPPGVSFAGKVKHASVRPKMEIVRGVACYVIDMVREKGSNTFWIDPEHGYQVARHRGFLKDGGPIGGLNSRGGSEVLRFEKVDDLWIPAETQGSTDWDDPYGKQRMTGSYRLFKLVLNPDHEALGSFKTDDIADGTLVTLVTPSSRRRIDPSEQRQWQKGELVPVDDELRKSNRPPTEEEIRELNAPARQPGGKRSRDERH